MSTKTIELSKYLDVYDIRARLFPALLSILPVTIAIYLYTPSLFLVAEELLALFAGFGGVYLLAQLARDRGKALEQGLFDKWSGMPSVTILRYRSSILPAASLSKLHHDLEELTGIQAPTPDFENRDPAADDDLYRSWSDCLRSKTKDTTEFALLFKENISYGFRRNFLGLKRFTILFSLLSGLTPLVINIEGEGLVLTARDSIFIVSSLVYAVTA